jgi:hypothetical protein
MPNDMTARAKLIAANAIHQSATDDGASPDPEMLANPDMSVLRSTRPPPPLPLDVFGTSWGVWLREAAEAASCPLDYVVGPLMAAGSALLGHSRWAQATPGWAEPPHLWIGVVGDSGGGKSPGADILMRDVLPEIERRMAAGWPELHREWRGKAAAYEAEVELWERAVRAAAKNNETLLSVPADAPVEPQCPALRIHDATIEKVALLLADVAPKGLLVVRDELAGWFASMTNYNDAGRAFWIEAYGGRSHRVDRVKHPKPIEIPRLAVAVTGGTQPEKLAQMMGEADDGLLARVCWLWPDRVPFRLGKATPRTSWAIEALDRLRALELVASPTPAGTPTPLMVPIASAALPEVEAFAQEMETCQHDAAGLMRSAYGKARGTALRISLVFEYLWWCGEDSRRPAPLEITPKAFRAAAHFVGNYLMPMAARVYGDAATSPDDRAAAMLARWIAKTKPAEVHVRKLQREVRLPGLKDAGTIHRAAKALMEAGWLLPLAKGEQGNRAKLAYQVNPRVYEVAP